MESQPTQESRSTEFAPVEGGTEQYKGGTLLVAAYVLLWLVLMGYLFMLWRKQRALGRRLSDLEAAMDRAAAAAGESSAKARETANQP